MPGVEIRRLRSGFRLAAQTPRKRLNFVGDLTAGVPPVPIPNTEVKPRRADGTARESVWERRSLPALNKGHAEKSAWPFLFGTTGAKRCVSRIPLSLQTVSRNS